jgi:hypothetical protein
MHKAFCSGLKAGTSAEGDTFKGELSERNVSLECIASLDCEIKTTKSERKVG